VYYLSCSSFIVRNGLSNRNLNLKQITKGIYVYHFQAETRKTESSQDSGQMGANLLRLTMEEPLSLFHKTKNFLTR
jgi:hypothetical protein